MGVRLARVGTALVVVAGVLVLPAAAQAAVTPAAGVEIKAGHSNKCLNIQGGTTADDVPLVQYNCSDAFTNDRFKVVPVGADTYQIVATFDNKCLNVYKAGVTDNTPVHQYTCSATATNNLWRFVPVAGRSTFRIQSVQSGKCLNVYRNSQDINTAVNIYTCTTADTSLNDQFYFPPAASAAGVTVGASTSSPVVAVQGGPGMATLGPIVYSYTTDAGHMWTGYQDSPENFTNVAWQSASGLDLYAGHPSVNVQADGRATLVAQNGGDADLDLSTQTAAHASTFSSWTDAGGSNPAGAAQPVTVKKPDGSLVTFAIIGGQLWHLPQDGTHLPYGGWRYLGGTNLTGEIAAGLTATGLRVFALDSTGAVQTATYSDGKLSDFTSLGGSGLTGRIGLAVRTGYLARIVLRAADGSLVTKSQQSDGTFESDWTTVPGVTAAGSPSLVRDPTSGKTGIVVRGTDGTVYFTQESAEGSGVWSSWLQASARVIVTDPTAFTYSVSSGGGWAYVVRDGNNQVYEVLAESVGSSFAKSASARGAAADFVEHALPKAPGN